jgi:flagellar secretion chaperone FliS
MHTDKMEKYRDSRVLAADPVALARILLEEALRSARLMQTSLKAGHTLERGRYATKTMQVLTEFALMLNDEAAPELSANLKKTCEYAQHRMMHAHIEQSEAKVAEVIALLQPILEAWTQVERRSRGQADSTSSPWYRMPHGQSPELEAAAYPNRVTA